MCILISARRTHPEKVSSSPSSDVWGAHGLGSHGCHHCQRERQFPGLGSNGLLLVNPLGGCYQVCFLELARSCSQARRAAQERHCVMVQHRVL